MASQRACNRPLGRSLPLRGRLTTSTIAASRAGSNVILLAFTADAARSDDGPEPPHDDAPGLRGTNSRGRSILLLRDRVAVAETN